MKNSLNGNFLYLYKVRIFSKGTLRTFWEKYPDSEDQLRSWHKVFSNMEFKSPNEVKTLFGSADFIGNGKMIFNICGNHYRLIVKINYEKHLVFVLFVGTHKAYDKLDIENL